MKKSARFTLPALLAGVMVVSPQVLASSSVDNEELSVGLRLGLYNLDSDRVFPGTPVANVKSGFKNLAPGIQLDARITDNWSVRSYLDYVKASVNNGSNKSGYALGADALYRFDNGIYAGPGIGATKVGDYKNRRFRGTLGYRQVIKDNLSWSSEYNLHVGSGFTDHSIVFGLALSFGNRGPALAQVRSSAEEEARRETAKSEATSSTKVEDKVTKPVDEVRSDEQYSPQIRAALAKVDRTVDSDGDGVPDYRDVCTNTPRGHAVDKHGCSVYEQQSQVHHIRVTFGFDSAEVPARYYDAIRDLAILVGVNPDLDVLIEGHTDLIGTAEYNKGLSERRAKAVADILKNEYGIESSRISAVGHGMSKPVVNQITLDANARNRRIETTITIKARD